MRMLCAELCSSWLFFFLQLPVVSTGHLNKVRLGVFRLAGGYIPSVVNGVDQGGGSGGKLMFVSLMLVSMEIVVVIFSSIRRNQNCRVQ